MTNQIIQISQIVNGNIAISMSKGNELYKQILQLIQNSEDGKIILDFHNVEIFASPFFNASIGYLLKDYDITFLQNKLHFENLNPVGNNLLNLVFNFYRKCSIRCLENSP